MSSSSSPCAACRFLRQKCTRECVFAPYFPVDQPEKFVSVHEVFGRSNVAKILKELNVTQREDAVRSLVYEADARLKDPVYGCVAPISLFQQRLRQLRRELASAKKELATYIGHRAMAPMLHSPPFMPQQQMGNPSSSSVMPHGLMTTPMMGVPTGAVHGEQLVMRELQQHQMFRAQQLTVVEPAREQQEMHNTDHEQQLQQLQQQLDLLRLDSSGSGLENSGMLTATALQHVVAASMSPPSALGTFDSENPSQVQPQAEHQHHQFQEIVLRPQEAESQPHLRSQQQLPQTEQQ